MQGSVIFEIDPLQLKESLLGDRHLMIDKAPVIVGYLISKTALC